MFILIMLRWPNTVFVRALQTLLVMLLSIKRALGLWYVNKAVDTVIPQFHMNWIMKLSFDLK